MINVSGPHPNLNETLMRPSPEMKVEFAKRLHEAMHARQWTQADLARAATTVAEDGIIVSRDNVSTYARGSSFPTDHKLRAIARALNMKPQDLMPGFVPNDAGPRFSPRAIAAISAFEMKAVPGMPNKAAIQVNRVVSWETAMQIAALLQTDSANDDTPDAKSSS